ncbi:phage antirepressor KilAC domain-containing protein [Acinetobacter baumannii]|uniref:phage antirepressor KilAC domain-containing protein n=2 Tax=Acinetobacter baumannii TaxID=470 RepID=UPI0022EB45E8|nr:phage antirepressor KilAC domain-containing protein [Acinetobacter baumannii]MDA3521969.1 phage antirepressor KilAC domain-containing protein [Acinetobacter baumannii]MDA3530960.1 phage antirepressor KilAC domain-containing protein [Acinetobacter baumannii]
MNMMTQFNHNQNTMSNIELLEVINQARKEFNEKPVRLNDFNNRIADELEGEYYETFVVRNPNGTTSQGFNLNIDQCTLIGMRESKSVRKNVLAILKEKQKPFDITNPAHLLQAIEVQAKLNIELTQKVAILEPKAKGLDRIADCTNVLGIRESAKVLKVGQNQLVQYLLDHKVVYRDQHGKIQAYQKSVDQKLIHVVTSAPRLFESGEKVFTQVKLTQKLITRIAKWLEQGVAA